ITALPGGFMAQTLVSQLMHIVFSTKNQENLITPEIEPELFAYLGGVARKHNSRLLAAGGTANHVHLLISQSKNIALCDLLEELKKSSSVWIKTKGKGFAGFHWQDGYSAFSVGASQIPALESYFARQKTHHQNKTFQEEFVEFLQKYGVAYNEKYLWT
ncbi:MAG: transposase, partial [Blastocatellia bacterium]